MSAALGHRDAVDAEIEALVDVVYSVYGYDFRNYAKESQKRRILSFVGHAGIDSISSATRRLADDKALFFEFLDHVTVPTTELFRDPQFFRAFLSCVVPHLHSYATLKIWHAGCSSGEEVYSMAILLHEVGLLERAVIYATDVDRASIREARKGIVSSRVLKRDTQNYFEAGLERSPNDYWHAKHGYALLRSDLLKGVVFSEHNLVTDGCFGEMHVILCRNVLIYFDQALQSRVLRMLVGSLARGGFLCLGTQESVKFCPVASELDVKSEAARIYRRKARL